MPPKRQSISNRVSAANTPYSKNVGANNTKSPAAMKQNLNNAGGRTAFDNNNSNLSNRIATPHQPINLDQIESIDNYITQLEKMQTLIDKLKTKLPSLFKYLASGINEGDSVQTIFHRIALEAQVLDHDVDLLIAEYLKNLPILEHFQKATSLGHLMTSTPNSQASVPSPLSVSNTGNSTTESPIQNIHQSKINSGGNAYTAANGQKTMNHLQSQSPQSMKSMSNPNDGSGNMGPGAGANRANEQTMGTPIPNSALNSTGNSPNQSIRSPVMAQQQQLAKGQGNSNLTQAQLQTQMAQRYAMLQMKNRNQQNQNQNQNQQMVNSQQQQHVLSPQQQFLQMQQLQQQQQQQQNRRQPGSNQPSPRIQNTTIQNNNNMGGNMSNMNMAKNLQQQQQQQQLSKQQKVNNFNNNPQNFNNNNGGNVNNSSNNNNGGGGFNFNEPLDSYLNLNLPQ